MTAAVLHGFVLALGLILPLGVQNTFVLTQGALHRKWTGALPAVLTASVCDTLLIGLAVSGVSLAVLAIPWFETALSWVGVLFLTYMGWMTWRSSPAAAEQIGDEWTGRRQVGFAASVSLLNPHAILDTIGVIGTNSLRYAGAEKLVYTLVCVLVSWLWFFGLAVAGRSLGAVASGVGLRRWLNRGSAVIMWAIALQFLLGLIGASV